MRFEGKAVIVTGASSGIGRACAKILQWKAPRLLLRPAGWIGWKR